VLKTIDSAFGTNTLERMLRHTGGTIPDIKALDAEEAIRAAPGTGLLAGQNDDLLSSQKGRVDQYARAI
jgi:hypothetical protein